MPQVSEVYGGSYLTDVDLAGRMYSLTIEAVAVEEVGDERQRKLVVAFKGAQKNLVLNKTNASTLVSAFGDDTDSWLGRFVEVFTVPTTFGGRSYEGIRVRAVVAQTSQLQAPAAGPVGVPASQTRVAMQHATAIGDGIPF